MRNKFIALFGAAAILFCGITASAANEVFKSEFTDTPAAISRQDKTPFDMYSIINAAAGSQVGVYGRASTDNSVYIKTTGKSAAPYLLKQELALADYKLWLGFSLAAEDKGSDKAVYISNTQSTSRADMALCLATDGGIYSYGTMVGKYETKRWYNFDLEYTADGKCNVYVDGRKAGQSTVPAGTLADSIKFYFATFGNTEVAETIAWLDDLYFASDAAVPQEHKITLESDTLSISGDTVSDVSADMTVSDFLASFVTDAVISVVDKDDLLVTSGTIMPGMRLKAVSADGANTCYYQIDCLNLQFNAPANGSSTKDATASADVSFSGTGTVRFYVNGTLYDTVDAAPYATVINHTQAGQYSVYAEVEVGGEVITTETRTYTYTPNKLPSVTISGITNNQEIDVDDVLNITVTADDEDGTLTDTALYVNGEKLSGTTHRVGPLPIGVSEIYAKATDNDGGVGTSAKYRITVRKTFEVPALESGTDTFPTAWSKPTSGGANAGITLENSGTAGVTITSPEGTQLQYDLVRTPTWGKNQREGVIELDISMDEVEKTFAHLFQVRVHNADGTGDAWDEGPIVGKGYIAGNTNYPMYPNTVYRLKYYFNIETKTARLWVIDKTTGAAGLAYETNAMTVGSEQIFKGMRINVNKRATPEVGWVLKLDNLKMYSLREASYVTATAYKTLTGADAMTANGVGYDLKTVELTFNNKLDTLKVSDKNIEVLANGVKQTNYTVEASDNILTVRFTTNVRSLSEYTIKYSGLIDEYTEPVQAGSVSFETTAAEYDCLSWKVLNGGVQITSTQAITKGDELKVSAQITNRSNDPQTDKLILAAYCGDKLAAYSITDFTATANTLQIPVTSNAATVTEDITAPVTVYAYVWSDISDTRRIKISSFELR